jgi:hypothetical protein
MLDPTTKTKRGNFGRYYPWSHTLVLHAWVGHGTMGFEMCESTSYIITRVDATSFRSDYFKFGCRRISKVGPPTNLEVNIPMMSG